MLKVGDMRPASLTILTNSRERNVGMEFAKQAYRAKASRSRFAVSDSFFSERISRSISRSGGAKDTAHAIGCGTRTRAASTSTRTAESPALRNGERRGVSESAAASIGRSQRASILSEEKLGRTEGFFGRITVLLCEAPVGDLPNLELCVLVELTLGTS